MSDSASPDERDGQIHEDEHLTMETVDRKAVGKVARYVSLVDVHAATMGASVSPHYVFEEAVPDQWNEHVAIGFDTHAMDRSEDEPERFRVMALFFAHFDRDWLNLDPDEIPSPPEDREVDIEIEVRFILEYALEEDCDVSEEELRHFGFFNGTFNAWSYWREYAQSASARLGLSPTLVIPVFRIPQV